MEEIPTLVHTRNDDYGRRVVQRYDDGSVLVFTEHALQRIEEMPGVTDEDIALLLFRPDVVEPGDERAHNNVVIHARNDLRVKVGFDHQDNVSKVCTVLWSTNARYVRKTP